MKPKLIGVYWLGIKKIKVKLRSGTGADTNLHTGEMLIGADERGWSELVISLMHEAQEVCMNQMDCSYRPYSYEGRSGANFSFFLTHEQFNEVCCRTGEFLTTVLPAMSKTWTEWRKVKKKRQ